VIDSFSKQVGPAGYYRWLVATRFLGLPVHYPNQSILDVGAHNGGFLDRLTANVKVGVDLMERPVQPQLWSTADATRLPFASDSFNQVMAFDIIEHIPADGTVLTEIARVLKPSGTLWLSTTCADYYVFPGGSVQRRLERSWGHVRRGYTQVELEHKLPDNLTGTLLPWNESAFRYLYVSLKGLHAMSVSLARMLMEIMYRWDVQHQHGQRGHWFARFTKQPDLR
jgi:ubiquinone/menaquinone biosynthesis C-methylase UbiE